MVFRIDLGYILAQCGLVPTSLSTVRVGAERWTKDSEKANEPWTEVRILPRTVSESSGSLGTMDL